MKYHVLLPEHAEVGGGIDYYQWAAILRAVSGYRSYHALYNEGIKPWLVADFLIMREEMPRSLVACMGKVKECLDHLADEYGQRHESHRMAGRRYSQLRFGKVDDVFGQGLHVFLEQFIDQNNDLGAEISRSYLM